MNTPEDIIPIIAPPPARPRPTKGLYSRRVILLASIGLLVAAWFVGFYTSGADALPLVPEVLPTAERIELRRGLYVGLDAGGDIVGYAASASSPGYSGPILLLVGIDTQGVIQGIKVVEQRETPGFFRLVTSSRLFEQYPGQSFNDPLQIGQGLDAVSGATVSSEAIAAAARTAARQIAADAFDTTLPPDKKPIKFGWPEIAVLGLYATGYFAHKLPNPKRKKQIRWGMMWTGILVLGAVYTIPLTISMFISLISGYGPDWHSHLYWYFLIGGVLFVTTVDSKNPYCSWFCPFGSFQEVLAQIGGARLYKPRKWASFFTWLQRGLAFTAVLLGLALRKPGVVGYEPFATLFDLRGTTFQWLFLGLVALASLFMYRPFCNYLCPVDPVVEFIAEVRRWVLEALKKWQPNRATK